jgi:Zn-dependent peptidase ImmA (M78 family)
MLKGFQEIELFDIARPAEYEANVFAAELLIDDNELLKLLNDDNMSFFDVARELYIPAALLDFKFRVLKHKGYRIEAPYIANGDFLRGEVEGCYDEEENF